MLVEVARVEASLVTVLAVGAVLSAVIVNGALAEVRDALFVAVICFVPGAAGAPLQA